jgi:phosphate starvation-inducible membrane PsiE
MDPMTDIPKDRKPHHPLRVIVLLGMTALLFLMLLNRFSSGAG